MPFVWTFFPVVGLVVPFVLSKTFRCPRCDAGWDVMQKMCGECGIRAGTPKSVADARKPANRRADAGTA
jgi:hypothetical protein